MNRITTLLAADHQIARHGLRAMLNLEADIKVVGEAETGRRAMGHFAMSRPDVVAMDTVHALPIGIIASSVQVTFLSFYHVTPRQIPHPARRVD